MLSHFFDTQLAEWEAVKNNYLQPSNITTRSISFDKFSINIQFNPTRRRSSMASVSPVYGRENACVLCKKNRPAQQESLPFNGTFDILVNPYPIFNRHFTVIAKEHTPQQIAIYFNDLIDLAKLYPECTVFYNGPKSGASAPNHLHFQMVPRHSMLLERDITQLKNEPILSKDDLTIDYIPDYLRYNLIIRSKDKATLHDQFFALLKILEPIIPSDPEPMMNIIMWYEQNEWCLVIFPRRKHRPDQFYEEGEKQILFSPGCVDFSGTIITIRHKEYNGYTPELLTELFRQLTISEEQWSAIIDDIAFNSK